MPKPVKDTPPSGEAGAPLPKNLAFEEALGRLEAIVESMENDALPLETLLAKYEEGSRLAGHCHGRLAEAELKIQQLERQPGGELRARTVDPAQV